jgi:hypothetical protein
MFCRLGLLSESYIFQLRSEHARTLQGFAAIPEITTTIIIIILLYRELIRTLHFYFLNFLLRSFSISSVRRDICRSIYRCMSRCPEILHTVQFSISNLTTSLYHSRGQIEWPNNFMHVNCKINFQRLL